jgi:hypothetical protein
MRQLAAVTGGGRCSASAGLQRRRFLGAPCAGCSAIGGWSRFTESVG